MAEAAQQLSLDGEAKIAETLVLSKFLKQIKGSSYFSYQGSLTTPDCNEVVSWIIMESPIYISESHVNIIII